MTWFRCYECDVTGSWIKQYFWINLILDGDLPMAEYKSLGEMRIKDPQEIARYSVQTIERSDEHIDVLRVVYKRKKGSLLPDSKRFRFPRIKKTAIEDSGSRKMNIRWEVSPFLQKAISELDHILSDDFTKKETLRIILDEMRRLEEDAGHRIEYIRGLIKDL